MSNERLTIGELIMVDRVLDLAKGEADVAFRTALVSRKLTDVAWALFASRSYVENHGQPERAKDINQHQVIGFGGLIAEHPAAHWLRSVARAAAICTTTPALALAVKSGAGLAPLPVAAVEHEPDLVRLLGSVPVTLHFYLVFHRDMRRTPRVRAFCDIRQTNDDVQLSDAQVREIERRLDEPSPRYLTLDQVRQRLQHFGV
jgi:DNA-binding transcriptional LysR family regulator